MNNTGPSGSAYLDATPVPNLLRRTLVLDLCPFRVEELGAESRLLFCFGLLIVVPALAVVLVFVVGSLFVVRGGAGVRVNEHGLLRPVV
jgi:hypothetical protein